MINNSHKGNTLKIGLFVTIIAIASLACILDPSTWGLSGAEPTATFPVLPSPTQVPTFPPQPVPTDTPWWEQTAEPTQIPPIAPTGVGPGSSATGAACLPGTWQIDHQSVINYMNLTMIGVGEYGFTPLSTSGKLELQIIPGQVNLLAENFAVNVGVNLGGVANVSLFDVVVQANGSATYIASNTQITLSSISYNAVGSIASLSADFNDLLDMANDMGFARGISHPIQTRYLLYTCSGDVLTIVVNKYASVNFWRAAQ